MDVIRVDRQHLTIVVNRIVILAKFGKAIGTIVESFDIICSAIFHLVGVVLDSVRESLHFAIHKAAVRVNYWIRGVKLYGLIKVVN